MTALVVTGTGTGVGKTVVAAALLAVRGGTYVKVAQTGVPGDVPDVDTVARLTGAATYEGARYAAPLSPEAAARHAGLPYANLAKIIDKCRDLGEVCVEGAGGLLVRYDDRGTTLADLALALDAPVVVVAPAGLGTLNATALTLEALARRGVRLAGVVIGAWPDRPGLTEETNLTDLATLAGGSLLGVLPDGAGAADRATFAMIAARSLTGGVTAWTS